MGKMMCKSFQILGKKTYNLQLHSLFINFPSAINLSFSVNSNQI